MKFCRTWNKQEREKRESNIFLFFRMQEHFFAYICYEYAMKQKSEQSMF